MNVYIIQSGNTEFYKIGLSVNPKKRLSVLQVGNPYKLKLIAVKKTNNYKELEIHLHYKFLKYKKQGEWFKLNNLLLKNILINYSFDILDKNSNNDIFEDDFKFTFENPFINSPFNT